MTTLFIILFFGKDLHFRVWKSVKQSVEKFYIVKKLLFSSVTLILVPGESLILGKG